MREKLTAKHPRPTDTGRAPVRAASGTGRKPARPAAALAAALKTGGPGKPAGPRGTSADAGGGRSFSRDTAKPRPARAGDEFKPRARRTEDGRSGDGFKARAPRAADGRSNEEFKPHARRTEGDRRSGDGFKPRAPRAADSRSNDEFKPRARRTEDDRRSGDGFKPRAPRAADGRSSEEFKPRARRTEDDRRSGDGFKPRAPRAADSRSNDEFKPRARRTEDDRRSGDGFKPRAPRAADGRSNDAFKPRAPARVTLREPAERRTARPVKQSSETVPARTRTDASEAGMMRLSKRMSELGLCSRREADEWIEQGWVRVDGERVDTLGVKVRPDQHIEIDDAARSAQAAQVTIVLHKPVGYVSGQAEDGYAPAVTLITRDNRWSGDRAAVRFSPQHLRTLAPAGRLDIDSTGLLVLTQNGRIAKQLIGEHSEIDKEYLVRVRFGDRLQDIDKHFPPASLALLRHGLSLDGAALKPAQVSWQNGEQLRFVLREGKKRQIRRMCELVGLEVIGLKRIRMGRVMLGNLPQGQWRYLAPDESF